MRLVPHKDKSNLIGKRVRLTAINDPYTRLEVGDEGVVTNIDCMGTVFVEWDSGSTLGLIEWAGDAFAVIEREEKS